MTEISLKSIQSLRSHIDEHYKGNQAAFGRAAGVSRNQVGKWIRSGYVMVGNKLCAVRRVVEVKEATKADRPAVSVS